MRQDATFIGIEIDDTIAADPAIAAKLQETCPVDIYTHTNGHLAIAEHNLDECILCHMCLDITPPGTLTVHRLYDEGPHT